ncbi:hypothetical protein [Spirosoma fluviale]|uniref:Uncharacterized protein n=1 Tax=Spirosoma fluviale TaxID=1597977 RepID=A0A286FCN9_9BACT|nr:hypothetical protein [Spirosoma fluviale]SOD81007.1 hypothetical protein SAMN06269250_1643 [Spirosoma fluviale]
MTVRQAIAHLYAQPEDAFYYWQGIFRYWIYRRSALRWLLRWHIRRQYEFRKVAAQDCYYAGECRCCGCRTPELFMADKACGAGRKQYPRCVGQSPCYPNMMNRTQWYRYKLNQR